MAKKTKIIIIILLVFTLGWVIYQAFEGQIQNSKYGIEISVKNVTSTGLELTVECEEAPDISSLHFESGYDIVEKPTLFGWKELPRLTDVYTSDLVYRPLGGSREFTLNWMATYGELPVGIYRIGMGILDQNHERVGCCYATFIVIESNNTAFFGSIWWNILEVIFVILVFFGLKWGLKHFAIKKKLINLYRGVEGINKKKIAIVGGSVLLVFSIMWFLYNEIEGVLENKKFGFEVSVKMVSSTGVEGNVTYRDTERFGGMRGRKQYYIERRTIWGWTKVAEIECEDRFSTRLSKGNLEEGEWDFQIDWSDDYGELSHGRYRVRYSAYKWAEDEQSTQDVGFCFIPFEISE